MGGNSTKSTKSKTTYGNTTTSNPYATATTTNKGTVAGFRPDTALESVYNFVNKNIDSLLNDYLTPNLNSATNQAKLNSFTNALNSSARKSLENSIINPLSSRNMLRSSQAADLYKNLSNQQTASLDDYITELLTSAQNESASMINNLLQAYMNGYNVISDMSDKSLDTSAGNATKTSTTTTSQNTNTLLEALKAYEQMKKGGLL